MVEISTKEQVVNLMEWMLGKQDPWSLASSYFELLHDIGTFAALVFVLFEACCDYFLNVIGLWEMLNHAGVYANQSKFPPLMCCQITWAIIEDSHQFFFWTITPDDFKKVTIPFPALLLMNIIGLDVQAIRLIILENFCTKWEAGSAVGTLASQGRTQWLSGSTTTASCMQLGSFSWGNSYHTQRGCHQFSHQSEYSWHLATSLFGFVKMTSTHG